MHIEAYRNDIYTCNRTRCGYCIQGCPVYQEHGFEFYNCRGKMIIARGLIENLYKPSLKLGDRAYRCCLCGYCLYKCSLKTVDIIEALRADLVDADLDPEPCRHTSQGILTYGNPYLKPGALRSRWAIGLFKPRARSKILLYVGCTYSYSKRGRRAAKAITKIISRSNIEVNYMGAGEPCCGSLMKTLGYWRDFKAIVDRAIESFNKVGCKTIVALCPACYKTFTIDYPESFNKNYEVIHITQFLQQLIDEGEIKPLKEVNVKAAYHDPCHLGRSLKIFDQPRKIIKSIPNIELKELNKNRYESRCCGGGLMAYDPELAIKIARKRLLDLDKVKVKTLITACPFCEETLDKARRFFKLRIKVYDISELLINSISPQP